MRVLFLFLLSFSASSLLAQNTSILSPSVLVIDTTLNAMPAFNSEVMKNTQGFRLVGSEREAGNNIVYTYSNGRDGTIHISYRYVRENGKDIIVYQSVSADLDVITAIYNGLFHTSIAPNIDQASAIGGPIEYRHNSYQCMMQAYDYRPGYWELSFIK